MNGKPTVFVVDDDPAVRESLTLLLEQKNITVESFASADSFLTDFRPVHLCCAIIDIRMPGMDGLQLQAELSSRGALLPIIFLTGHGDIPQSVSAIKAGAVDFLTKPVSSDALLQSVQEALSERERMIAQSVKRIEAAARVSSLTEREREVMFLAVEGMANKEIANRLGISHRTVEIHRARIMQKVGVETVVELVHLAEAAGYYPEATQNAEPGPA